MSLNMTEKNNSRLLSSKVNAFLSSRKNANVLTEILNLFQISSDNYTQELLCCEKLFSDILKRRDLLIENDSDVPVPELEYKKWLRECYENFWTQIQICLTTGKTSSKNQALATAMNLLKYENLHPLESIESPKYIFPINRLKNIFTVIIHEDISMNSVIKRFQEFLQFSDVVQFGLKALISLQYKKNVTHTYMNNFLELFDAFLSFESTMKEDQENTDEKSDKLWCTSEKQPKFHFSRLQFKKNINKAWDICIKWPLCSEPKIHRRSLLLLIEKVMPHLNRPELATDMLMDSLDSGGAISVLALQGILQVVRQHNIDYPDIYDRLYVMLQPEMFSTKYKTRLMNLTDTFLSSTHLPEALVAAFIKRLARLSLIAPPEDAILALQLIGNLMHRHPALKKMICNDSSNTVMSGDPYVEEETTPIAANALNSSLWEVAALQSNALPSVAAAAHRLITNADSFESNPVQLVKDTSMLFDLELKKRFKSIEVNFIRPQSMALSSGERLAHYWNLVYK